MIKEFLSEKKNIIIVSATLAVIVLLIIVIAVSCGSNNNRNTGPVHEVLFNGEDQPAGVLGKELGYPANVSLTYSGNIVIEIAGTDRAFGGSVSNNDVCLTIYGESGIHDNKKPFQIFEVSYHNWCSAMLFAPGMPLEYSVEPGEVVQSEWPQLPREEKFSLLNYRLGVTYDFYVRIDEDGNLSLLNAEVNEMSDFYTDIDQDYYSKYSAFKVPDGAKLLAFREDYFKDNTDEGIVGAKAHVRIGTDITKIFVTSSENEEAILKYYERHNTIVTETIGGKQVTIMQSDRPLNSAYYVNNGIIYLFKNYTDIQELKDVLAAWLK